MFRELGIGLRTAAQMTSRRPFAGKYGRLTKHEAVYEGIESYGIILIPRHEFATCERLEARSGLAVAPARARTWLYYEYQPGFSSQRRPAPARRLLLWGEAMAGLGVLAMVSV